ncbi:MAG: DUF58 domain-containing protein [Bacteroidia bacterium]|nr:DUF58 domain-containing protein [Bacteroidia bacterium]HPE86541.1 DUF58 domain-containing protein [Bacteroidales bacterium]
METSAILKKVRKIEIKTRGLSSQIFAGHYHSAFKGRGMAFNEVREYQYGDDIRNIDWNVTARLNHPYVKIYEEERELTVILLIDVSGSNEFGTKSCLKEDLITEVSSVLAFSAITNNDKVGVVFFSNKVEKFIPPKKGTSHILRIIRELIDFHPEHQQTDISEALRFLSNAIKKRATVFLISDFLDGDFERALRIANHKHDIVALRVVDPAELSIPDLGFVRVFDKEKGERRWVDTSSKKVREHYRAYFEKKHRTADGIFIRNGIDSAVLTTHSDYVKPLMLLFRKRESRF